MMHSILEYLEQGVATPLPDGRTEVRFCVASCLDCDDVHRGTLEECRAWLAEHKERTGHRA